MRKPGWSFPGGHLFDAVAVATHIHTGKASGTRQMALIVSATKLTESPPWEESSVPFAFTCPHCGDRIDNMDDSFAGRTGPCRKCGKTVTWQAPVAAAPPKRVSKPSSADSFPDAARRLWIVAIAGVLLTVAAFIVMALLLPGMVEPRRWPGQNFAKLRSLAMAVDLTAKLRGVYPAPASYDQDGKPLLSWRVHLLPYLDRMDLYQRFHLDEPWDSPHNRTLIEQMPEPYWTRGGPDPSAGKTCFLAIVDDRSMLPQPPAGQPEDEKLRRQGGGIVPAGDIPDGASRTIVFVEADSEHAVIWTKPGDLPGDPAVLRRKLSRFRGGFLVVFADGRAKLLRTDLDDDLLRGLILRNDGLPKQDERHWLK